MIRVLSAFKPCFCSTGQLVLRKNGNPDVRSTAVIFVLFHPIQILGPKLAIMSPKASRIVITFACGYYNVGFLAVYKMFVDAESVPEISAAIHYLSSFPSSPRFRQFPGLSYKIAIEPAQLQSRLSSASPSGRHLNIA